MDALAKWIPDLIIAVVVGLIGYWAGRRRGERNRKLSETLRKPTP